MRKNVYTLIHKTFCNTSCHALYCYGPRAFSLVRTPQVVSTAAHSVAGPACGTRLPSSVREKPINQLKMCVAAAAAKLPKTQQECDVCRSEYNFHHTTFVTPIKRKASEATATILHLYGPMRGGENILLFHPPP